MRVWQLVALSFATRAALVALAVLVHAFVPPYDKSASLGPDAVDGALTPLGHWDGVYFRHIAGAFNCLAGWLAGSLA